MILNKEVFKITTDKSQTCEAIKFYSPIAIQGTTKTFIFNQKKNLKVILKK